MKSYRIGQKLRQDKIKRFRLLAIVKNFEADLYVGSVSFYNKKRI